MVKRQEMNKFEVNKEIAYNGKLGSEREAFNIDFIKRKTALFNEMKDEMTHNIQRILRPGDKISCQKGCSFCCVMYVEATIQECEAIVYHLYHNAPVLNNFLATYPRWREQVRRNGDIWKECNYDETKEDPKDFPALNEQITKKMQLYRNQDISCPFLVNNGCSIYDVRPYMCAIHYSVSQPDCCQPENSNAINVVYPLDVTPEKSFFYRELDNPVVVFMPICVHEILHEGVSYYASRFPGFEKFDTEFYREPEVDVVLEKRIV
jgi:Fe-S-cluster containining protein